MEQGMGVGGGVELLRPLQVPHPPSTLMCLFTNSEAKVMTKHTTQYQEKRLSTITQNVFPQNNIL